MSTHVSTGSHLLKASSPQCYSSRITLRREVVRSFAVSPGVSATNCLGTDHHIIAVKKLGPSPGVRAQQGCSGSAPASPSMDRCWSGCNKGADGRSPHPWTQGTAHAAPPTSFAIAATGSGYTRSRISCFCVLCPSRYAHRPVRSFVRSTSHRIFYMNFYFSKSINGTPGTKIVTKMALLTLRTDTEGNLLWFFYKIFSTSATVTTKS